MKKFQSHGRQYEIDQFGAIHQTDAKPFIYDANYCSTYDTPEYQKNSEILQALRLGFVLASHGRHIESILDCGYGNGAFMRFAARHIPSVLGKDVTGIQVDDCKIVDEYVPAEVYTFWDCFEHIPDLSFIAGVPCQTLVISLPWCHYRLLGKDYFDTEYRHRKPDEHLHHFSASSLDETLNHYGWKLVSFSNHEDIIRKSTTAFPNILTMSFKRKKI